jgi:hypothetical protein
MTALTIANLTAAIVVVALLAAVSRGGFVAASSRVRAEAEPEPVVTELDRAA